MKKSSLTIIIISVLSILMLSECGFNNNNLYVPSGEQTGLVVSNESNVFDEPNAKTDGQNNGLTDNTRQSEFSIEEQIVIDKVGDSIFFDKANDDSPTFIDTKPLWSEMRFKATDASESKSIVFNGITLSGAYYRSSYEKYNSQRTDIYRTENGYQFGVFAETGKIERVNFQDAAFFENERNATKSNLTMSEIETTARQIAESLVGDLSKYKQFDEKPQQGDGFEYYFFTYYREIGGFNTSDCVAVKITSNGTLASVIVGDTGVFDNVLSVDIDNDALISSIRDRVAAQVNGTDGYTFINGSVEKQFLALMPEGDYCIVTEYEFRFSEDGVDEPYSSGVRVLTKII